MFLLRTQILTPFLQQHRPHLSAWITVFDDWKNTFVFTFETRQLNAPFLHFELHNLTAFYVFTQNNCLAIIPLLCTPSPKGLGCTQMPYHSTALLFDLPKSLRQQRITLSSLKSQHFTYYFKKVVPGGIK